MIQLTGSQWNLFIEDKAVWGDATTMDDTIIRVNGDAEADLEKIPADAVVEVENGYIDDGLAGVPDDLVDAVKWWLARQSTKNIVVSVPNDRVEEVAAALAALGLTAAIF